jgi:hypothetical protein
MKTAISLPSYVFYAAEEEAHYLSIPRSTLYANALVDYLQRNSRKNITKKLDDIYNDDYYAEFEPIANAGLNDLTESTKNDSW